MKSVRHFARIPHWFASMLVAIAVAGCGYIWLPGGRIVNFSGKGGKPIPEAELQSRIRLPPGFTIQTYWQEIKNARMLRFTAAGDLLVSSPKQGKIFLLGRDAAGDGRADGVRVLIENLNQPHGLELHQGGLYVAETDAVRRIAFDAASGTTQGSLEDVVVGLPGGEQHWTRTVAIGPDGWLYLSIGSTCNVCLEADTRRAAILRYRPDGSGEELYATGLRNSVGLAWQPATGDLYATENGRDFLGDDFPPDELNRIEPRGFYGWPFAHGKNVADPEFGKTRPDIAQQARAPAHEFGAHVAALGITFYAGSQFPQPYRGAAFVALHGSYNRRQKIGYEVVALHFAADGSIREEKFASGFEIEDDVIGRPVDVAVGPDGALYISDDYAGSIYRVSYVGQQQ